MQRNLLLVDDERNIQSSMRRALKQDGYNIYCADSGKDALDILAQHKIHVIISDQRMPGMTGSELFGEVSQHFPETIRIVLSGYADFSAVTDAINQGAIYKFLTKPWDDSLLRGHVTEAFQRYELSWHNRQLTEVFNSTTEGVMITDNEGVIQVVNPAFTTITGYSQADVVGHSPQLLRSDKEQPERYQEIWHSLTTRGQWHGELWNQRKNGEDYPQWMTISALPDDESGKNQYVALFIDITEQKEREACIEYQAYHDALTGLPNRRLFHDRLEQAQSHAKRNNQMLAVLFIDLDRFKTINDSLGHDIGDLLLQAAAQRLSDIVRKDDTVARFGGDEFTVLLSQVAQRQDVEKVVQKLIATFNQPFNINQHRLHVTFSVGAAIYPGDGESPEQLIKNADTAMYRTKDAGRNGYHFYSQSMNAGAERHLMLENDLHNALANNELIPYYQVQQDLQRGRINGMEALLRWHHPQHGFVMPGEFITLAEENGLIIPIGSWVLEQACLQAKTWLDAGLSDITMAVNLSARQLQQPNLLELVQQVLARTGLPARHLELEITENLLLNDTERNIALLHQLHDLGIQLALDDFGTGYSSLSYLKKFPFDLLKIDQSFVRGLPDNQEDAALVDIIISMGHKLGMKVIAEGVETQEQLTCLQQLGCDLAQGYLISKPIPAAQAEKLLNCNGGNHDLED
ncbi:diguanylate cyclase/phosphodiesterase (GGDEF & EAL domains) with PAS/PAC sensor(s) [hydrothermal vent metagenome]|uniref:Diguanylate cyclase/phosphodiesterase (GGDEF & EAL domains) with PAS/PAC sensor(S) n=1 Tax=hydrothermal vent metagenome TaxID=652676 RepID=A0A3B1BH42_9ZZZZ